MIFLLIVEFSLVAAMGLSWSSSFDEQLEQAALEEAELAVDARKAGCPGPLGGKRRNMTPLVGVTLGTFASIWGWVKTYIALYYHMTGGITIYFFPHFWALILRVPFGS